MFLIKYTKKKKKKKSFSKIFSTIPTPKKKKGEIQQNFL